MNRILTRYLLVVVGLIYINTAQALPIKWVLQDVVFNDQSTATGSYFYDADTNMFSNINVATSTMGNVYTVVNPSSGGNSSFLALLTTDVGDLTGVPELTMALASAMTNAGGTLAIVPDFVFSGGTGFSFEGACSDPSCSGFGPQRGISSGSVTTRVPVPATLPLMALGLCLLSRRKQRALPG